MGLRSLLGKRLSRGSVLAALGSLAAGAVMKRKREAWEQTAAQDLEAALEKITAYDIARGAGKLLSGWLSRTTPDIDAAEAVLEKLLTDMDREDETHYDRARSRLIVSKALFYLEGFRMGRCRYEAYQTEARDLLRRNPEKKNVSRRKVFLGKPFEPELLIGTTHRMLLSMESPQLYGYLAELLEREDLRDDAEYMARLLAVTFGEKKEEAFVAAVERWFRDYRDFKIAQTHRQEEVISTSLGVASGRLPTMLGAELLGKLFPGGGKKGNGKGRPEKD